MSTMKILTSVSLKLAPPVTCRCFYVPCHEGMSKFSMFRIKSSLQQNALSYSEFLKILGSHGKRQNHVPRNLDNTESMNPQFITNSHRAIK